MYPFGFQSVAQSRIQPGGVLLRRGLRSQQTLAQRAGEAFRHGLFQFLKICIECRRATRGRVRLHNRCRCICSYRRRPRIDRRRHRNNGQNGVSGYDEARLPRFGHVGLDQGRLERRVTFRRSIADIDYQEILTEQECIDVTFAGHGKPQQAR